MHDPVDQPSDPVSSHRPCANDERNSSQHSAAVPVIQIDLAPAMEPQPNVDQDAHGSVPDASSAFDSGASSDDPPHLVTPTMWR
jgi:hypothetical protein